MNFRRKLDADNSMVDEAVMQSVLHVAAKIAIIKSDGHLKVSFNEALKMGDQRVAVEVDNETGDVFMTLEPHPRPVTNRAQAAEALRRQMPQLDDETIDGILEGVPE